MSGNISSNTITPSSVTLVPVTTNATYSLGPIMIGFMIIAILVGVVLFLFASNHNDKYDNGGGHMSIDISNLTELHYEISSSSSGAKILLLPGEEANMSISQHDLIKAYSYNYDGTESSHTFKVSNPSINHLYITPSGIRSNMSGSEDTLLVNDSSFPILFIERSPQGGRRWASVMLPPGTSIKHFVGKRTTWEVANTKYEDDPLDFINIGGKAERIVFDGEKLISY